MPKYSYRARDSAGNLTSGAIEAPATEIAMDTLKDRGFFVLSLEERKPTLFEREIPFFNKIPIRDIVIFSRQFSVLMGAKVPIVKALKTVARQTAHVRLQRILVDIGNEVESGTALSQAMGNYPKAFTPFFVNMVRSGETTGRLEDVMNYLADQMERDFDLMAKIKGAMTYPIFIMIGLTIVGFIMMVFVVPKLTQTLSESGTELPFTTKILIGTSSFMKNNVIQIVIGAFLLVGAMRWWTSTPNGRKRWHRFILMLPVFGPLLKRIYIVRFTRSMATLLTGGVAVPESLQIAGDIVGNAAYQSEIEATRKEVLDGNSITTIFMESRVMPQMIPQMMSVGEETGKLNEVLERLTSFYSRELQNMVANLVSAIEPLIMLIMGLAVGVMVAAIIMPMYSLATQF